MRAVYVTNRYVQQRFPYSNEIWSNCPLACRFLSWKVEGRWPEMFLQHQCNGPTQTRHETFRRSDARRLPHQHASRDFRLDHWTETMPLTRNITYDHDLFGSHAGNDHAHATADGARHPLQSAD